MRQLISFTILLVVFGFFPLQAEDDPLIGTWKFVPEKSHYSSGGGPKAAIARYEPYGENGVKFTSEIEMGNGNIVKRGWIAYFDGKEHPVTGDPNYDSIAMRRINSHTILYMYKKAGNIMSAQVRYIHPDGKTQTMTHLGVSANGQPIDNTVVFERQ
ncbi:MAG: hypothetical protein HY645_04120 [Acidobacteria bacterium]|nr:hypothetical protein [Acidobacteriota bacterium]